MRWGSACLSLLALIAFLECSRGASKASQKAPPLSITTTSLPSGMVSFSYDMGGGAILAPPKAITPLPMTGTSGSIQRSTSVTLIVQ
jgi:hypothetical protein